MAAKVKSKEEVLELVRKLLNLADRNKNDSEHQAKLALDRAHQMLEEHGLDMAEVQMQEGGSWDIEEWMDEPKSQYDTWNKHLGFAAGILFNCKVYITTRGYNRTGEYRLKSMTLVGEAVDVAMAREVWPWLTKKARQLARDHAGKGWNASHRSFCEAFSTRIWLRANEQCKADELKKEADRTVTREDGTQQEVCTALVVAEKKSAIEQWLADRGVTFKKSRQRARTGEFDWAAGAAGDSAGKNVNLNFNRQVGNNNSQRLEG